MVFEESDHCKKKQNNNSLTTPKDAVYKYFKMNSMCFYLGFATWTCDGKTAEWREMPNIDDCVSKDVRKKTSKPLLLI